MNLDTLNSQYKVVSKYFSGKTVMDESLTDFQEKKSFKVLKNKVPAVKPKVKKVKRVKGQKDIRTALKQKKNELIAYSEDFNTVCKTSGIDVDSEQLQLAIALSKSLQQSESSASPTSCSKPLTTQQRTGLIRSTLKEYGFKVPEKPNTSRKTKKRRKPYKLLLASDEEKQQIISDRYSQLLFELNNLKTKTNYEDLVAPNLFIYNMSTNVDYENIKDDSIFYVENLIGQAPNTVGSLLKDWTDIPGRPLSPVVDKSDQTFSEIECSQEELDIVLSGHLRYCKDILKKKKLLKNRQKCINYCTVEEKTDKTILAPDSLIEKYGDGNKNNCEKSKKSSTVVIDVQKKNFELLTQPSRSLSPDLFDDDEDTGVEIPSETITENLLKLDYNVTKETHEDMDLTECVNIMPQKCNNNSEEKQLSQLSQQVDVTKRKSNDFMEMTDCVTAASQPVLERVDEQIDLTACCENLIATDKNINSVESVKMEGYVVGPSQHSLNRIDECIDLTKNCGEDIQIKTDYTPDKVKTTGSSSDFLQDKTNEHIDLTGYCVNNMEIENNSTNANNVEQLDLTQSSNSSIDTLPFVHISGKPTVPDKSLDDTIILNEDDYMITMSPGVNKEPQNFCSDTKSPEITTETETNTEDDIDQISTKTIPVETPIINLEETYETVDANVDLTQTSDTNEAPGSDFSNVHHINNSSLGKKDDVSVDYDEALENMNNFSYYNHDENDDNSAELNNAQKSNKNLNCTSNKQSVLEVSNNELNSPDKITNVDDNFDFGGISVIDNLSSFNRKSRNTMNSIPNGSMRDSLPMVNIKGKGSPEKPKSQFVATLDNQKSDNAAPRTPKTIINKNLVIETPEQSEYIVKTDNVTPMLDYASMSTPERNKELDKYGLKPFKRKRAIQLLTHLYNQTHPYVESTDELPSPSKKRKTEDLSLSQPSSSKSSNGISTSPKNKSKSPRKVPKSPRKQSRSPKKRVEYENLNESDKENDLFTVTSEVPAIRNVECDADDWVFQKREKAKLYTCRVPLHIAFHNYVSCRQRLHEAMLRYEPISIDVIHRELAATGHRYDPKDLLKFMDKKCITVKTADNAKNNKRY